MSSIEILEKLLKHLGISANKLSVEIGHSSNVRIYHIKNGRNNFSADLANDIVKRYPDINYSWLLNGKGGITNNLSIIKTSGGKIEVQKVVDIVKVNLDKFEANEDYQKIIELQAMQLVEKLIIDDNIYKLIERVKLKKLSDKE